MKQNSPSNNLNSPRPYETPVLTQYGTVEDLTKGGTNNSGEGNPNFDKVKRP